jgi:2-amino-4-hydroxy-6-hydroxymethyldihydropteridine diphosphokinase
MILVGIGANLPTEGGTTPLDTVRWAAAQLSRLPGLWQAGLSRWYRTAPVPPSAQPSYVNGVSRLQAASGRPEPDPVSLLAWLHELEAQAGRVRSLPNAARTLDLDIIAMGEKGELMRAAPDPILPHPRTHQRAFVLVPLLDVAPEWVHPVLGRGARDLLAEVDTRGVQAL